MNARTYFFSLSLLTGLVSGNSAEPAGTASIALLNNYVSRGYRIGQHSLVIQPNLSASYKGFTANLFANYDTDQHTTPFLVTPAPGTNRKGVLNECDVTLSYTRAWGKFSVMGGWSYFGYHYTLQTQELFLSATYDTFFKPTLFIYQDIAAYPATYANLAVSHSIPVKDQMTVDMCASMGYEHGGDMYRATPTSKPYRALHDGMIKLGMTIPLNPFATLQPMMQYWVPLSSDAKKDMAVDANANPFGKLENTFVFGATVGMSF